MVLDASLITGIDPPQEVESALAAINTAHNEVSSTSASRRPAADQKIVQSRRAVEIETLARAGRGRTAEGARRRSLANCAAAAPTGWRPTCATCGWGCSPRRSKFFWRPNAESLCRSIFRLLPVGGGFFQTAFVAFIVMFVSCRSSSPSCRAFGLYAVVEERTCRVYVLFGKVIGVLGEPGLHYPADYARAGGVHRELLRQVLRARPAARPGIPAQPAGQQRGRRADGHRHLVRDVRSATRWRILFNNMDPRGSLRANISNATVRSPLQHAAGRRCWKTATP